MEPTRRNLPDERRTVTHKFNIAGHEVYINVGLYEDGTPGEIFLVMAKPSSTISGFADAFAQAVSYALQYGVPLQVLVDKFINTRFEPSGETRNPQIRFATSIVDYVFRWMATKFLPLGAQPVEASELPQGAPLDKEAGQLTTLQEEAPPCKMCGAITVSIGGAWKCINCGWVA